MSYNNFDCSNTFQTIQLLLDRRVAHNIFFTRAPPIRTSGALRDDELDGRPSLVTVYIFPRRCTKGKTKKAARNTVKTFEYEFQAKIHEHFSIQLLLSWPAA